MDKEEQFIYTPLLKDNNVTPRNTNIVFLCALRNGDRLYLVNNCFIHSSIYFNEVLLIDEDVDVFINGIKQFLQEELEFNLFYFISIYPTPEKTPTKTVSKYIKKGKTK